MNSRRLKRTLFAPRAISPERRAPLRRQFAAGEIRSQLYLRRLTTTRPRGKNSQPRLYGRLACAGLFNSPAPEIKRLLFIGCVSYVVGAARMWAGGGLLVSFRSGYGELGELTDGVRGANLEREAAPGFFGKFMVMLSVLGWGGRELDAG